MSLGVFGSFVGRFEFCKMAKCNLRTKDNKQMSDSIKLVIAGLGLVGKRHADAIDKEDDIDLVAIVDPSEDAVNYSNKNNLPIYPSLKDMFLEEVPDGVILATPTPMHSEHAIYCLNKKCPIMIEKPIATSSEEARALVETSEHFEIPVLVGHHRRHNPIIQKAREIILSGEIGEIRAIHGNCWFYKPDEYFEIAPWRKKKGAGPISVNLVHDIDLIRHLCGQVESVQAQCSPSIRGFENEDMAAALLKFENGAIGTITVSDSIVAPWSWEMTSKENPIYPSTSESCYVIGGTHGSLSIPDLTVWTHKEERDWWKPITSASASYEPADPLQNQLRHFVNVVKNNQKPLVSGREGLRTLQVIEAIQKSALTQQSVKVETLEGIRC